MKPGNEATWGRKVSGFFYFGDTAAGAVSSPRLVCQNVTHRLWGEKEAGENPC